MMYLFAKALHLLAMVVWMAGMIFVPLAIRSYRPGSPSVEACRRLSGLFRNLCTPAMIAVWVLGLGIASTGGWLAEGWLTIKLVLVTALSGVHGVIAGRLRLASQGGGVTPVLGAMHIPALAILSAIVLLAIFRPV